MRNPSMKSKPYLKFWMDGLTGGRTDQQAQSNMPLQLFQSWGHKYSCNLLSYSRMWRWIITWERMIKCEQEIVMISLDYLRWNCWWLLWSQPPAKISSSLYGRETAWTGRRMISTLPPPTLSGTAPLSELSGCLSDNQSRPATEILSNQIGNKLGATRAK